MICMTEQSWIGLRLQPLHQALQCVKKQNDRTSQSHHKITANRLNVCNPAMCHVAAVCRQIKDMTHNLRAQSQNRELQITSHLMDCYFLKHSSFKDHRLKTCADFDMYFLMHLLLLICHVLVGCRMPADWFQHAMPLTVTHGQQ